jgi:exosortase
MLVHNRSRARGRIAAPQASSSYFVHHYAFRIRVMPTAFLTSRPLAAAALLAGLCAGWWPVAVMLAERGRDPQYSHGWIVPILAAGILWIRRDELRTAVSSGRRAGLLLILEALVLQMLGAWWSFDFLAAVSLIPAVAGGCVLLGGWGLLRKAAPAILFLIFLAPLPWSLESTVSAGLQRAAAEAAAVCLQTIGIPAVARGAMLELPSTQLGVSEACSGLRMLMVLAALTTAMVLLSNRPRRVNALLILSAAPIAVVCNVVRITATAFVVENAGTGRLTDAVHDVAGWLMIPLALAIIAAEMRLLGTGSLSARSGGTGSLSARSGGTGSLSASAITGNTIETNRDTTGLPAAQAV